MTCWTLRAPKGASQSRAASCQHVLRNSLLPIVTILGMDLGTRTRRRDLHREHLQPPRLGHEIINAYNFDDIADDHRHRRVLDDLRASSSTSSSM